MPREPDPKKQTPTPFAKFEALAKRIVRVPKGQVDDQQHGAKQS